MTTELSLAEARALALTAQGLRGSPFGVSPATAATASPTRRARAARSVVEHLGAVQLDTISVLARSHELVLYARLGAIGRTAAESALWPVTGGSFEYWSHAACVLPAELWPWFAFRRRWYQRRGVRWHDVPHGELARLRRALAEEGPLTTADVGGAKAGADWWQWSEAKVGLEWLLDVGEAVVATRAGWRRVYDVPARALDPALLARGAGGAATWTDDEGIPGPTDAECMRHLVLLGARAVGVGTAADVLDVHRLTGRYTGRAHLTALLDELVSEGSLARVDVRGWSAPAYADPALLAAGPARGRGRTTLLSPFDSLVWHRDRTERLFGMRFQLEAYVPAHKREHGYFTMPVLHRGRLVARVDPKRERNVLHARTVTFETDRADRVPDDAIAGTAAALVEAATWVGCTDVRLGQVRPASAAAALSAALRAVSP